MDAGLSPQIFFGRQKRDIFIFIPIAKARKEKKGNYYRCELQPSNHLPGNSQGC